MPDDLDKLIEEFDSAGLLLVQDTEGASYYKIDEKALRLGLRAFAAKLLEEAAKITEREEMECCCPSVHIDGGTMHRPYCWILNIEDRAVAIRALAARLKEGTKP